MDEAIERSEARGSLEVEIPGDNYYAELVPCQHACPVGTDARGYVRAIAEGRFEEAYLIARAPNPFASICGRVCGAPCETACRRGKIPRVDADGNYLGNDRPIAIRALKRFVCERFGVEGRDREEILDSLRDFLPAVSPKAEDMAALIRGTVEGRFKPGKGEAVAIIGGGPAGLSAAHDLALLGFRPVVFELERTPGGMLGVGIPEYRLPRELIRREIAVIEALGTEIRYGVEIGKDISFAELRRQFAAVIIAVGAKRSRSLGLPGESGPGVLGGVDLLRAVSLGEEIELGHDVLVIGGGNVAYDVARSVVRQAAYDTARTARRLPTTRRVTLVSLETLEEMPADTVEIQEGDEEGIERLNGWGPLRIERDTDGLVRAVEFQRCLRVYDENRRFAPVFDEEKRMRRECDTVLLAVGQATNLEFLEDGGEDIEEFRPGWIKTDPDTLESTGEGVFVAGDLAHGTRLLIDAVASGKKAARSVYRYLTGVELRPQATEVHLALPGYKREPGYETRPRQRIPVRPPERRLGRPDMEVEIGYDELQARLEAGRCLDCGVTPVFDGTRCVLCGGCVDVCPTACLKLVPISDLKPSNPLSSLVEKTLGAGAEPEENSAILKDEDRCIRCAFCVMRCPVEAIVMERYVAQPFWRKA